MKHKLTILGTVYVITLLIFLIVFHNEPYLSIIRFTIALAALTYIPGYFLTTTLFTTDTERLLYGSAMSIVIIAGSAYYLGLLGIPLNITAWALPALLITTGVYFSR